MRITCENCGAEIDAEHINIKEMVGVCTNCNHVLKINRIAESPKETVEYAMPPGIEMYEDYDALIIERKWFSVSAFFLVFFCTFWDGFMIMWYSIAISQKAWIMAAFGTIHALVGIGLTYSCVAMFINKTRIKVSSLDIEITHYPLPAPGKKTLSSSDFKQFYTKEKVSHTKNGVSVTYELYGISHSEERIKILDGIQSPEQVKYMEQQIEKYLNIQDENVTDEVRI